jgi:hypothetical protein
LCSLVVICKNGKIQTLLTTDGLELTCLNPLVAPMKLGIPAEWNG